MHTERKMIIFKDSDLYAVINCLIVTDDFPLKKMWVHEQVKEKFLWLMERHSLSLTIDTFQSLEDIELHLCYEYTTMNVLSIWSGDITAMKNLALSLNVHYLNYTYNILPRFIFKVFIRIIFIFLNHSESHDIHKYIYGFLWYCH